ncbi:phosphotransferase [Brachybacterium sp. DNPG3]
MTAPRPLDDEPAPPLPRILQELGMPDAPVRSPERAGVVNRVAIVGPAGAEVVVRCQRAPDAAEFECERWASDAARAAGIPTPRILAVGHLVDAGPADGGDLDAGSADGWAWSVQELVDGTLGEHAADPSAVWRELGRLSRRIARLDLAGAPDGLFSRFGRDLDAAWEQHHAYGLDELAPGDPLVGLGVYRDEDRSRLREILAGIGGTAGGTADGRARGSAGAGAPVEQGLLHGDLALRNVLLDADGQAVLIDWGSVRTGPVPLQETVHLLGVEDGDPGADGIRAFLTGFAGDEGGAGDTGDAGDAGDAGVDALLAQARALQVLETLDLVRWALDRAPAQIDQRARTARALVGRVLARGAGPLG